MEYNNRLGTAKALCKECYEARKEILHGSRKTYEGAIAAIANATYQQIGLQARMKVMELTAGDFLELCVGCDFSSARVANKIIADKSNLSV